MVITYPYLDAHDEAKVMFFFGLSSGKPLPKGPWASCTDDQVRSRPNANYTDVVDLLNYSGTGTAGEPANLQFRLKLQGLGEGV